MGVDTLGDNLLTVDDTAIYLRVSKSTVYRYIKRNTLPHIKKSFGLRLRKVDLDEWLDRDKIVPNFQLFDRQHVLTVPPISLIDTMGGVCELAKSKSKTRYYFGYGAIYQRKTKGGKIRWYLDYRGRNGKRIQKVASLAITKEEAALALQEEIKKTFDREYGIKRDQGKIKFIELADMYLENYAKLNKKSWRDDQYRIVAHMIPFLKEFELQKITPLLIEKYRAERLKKGITKSTVNREVTIMKKMFNLAIDWNLANNNPVLKIKLFSEKDTMKERRID